MSERPILFSGAMVRALLAGTKTQTRRLIKPQPDFIRPDGRPIWLEVHHGPTIKCPYGQPGDRLWVRENGWQRPERTAKMMREGADTWAPYYYDADGISPQESADFKAWGFKRRPSIHMPRWASRIVLEIFDVRVERLHSISEADCIAEGTPGGHGAITGYSYNATPREHYQHVWTRLNGASSYAANPWVWVVHFRRVAQAATGSAPAADVSTALAT